MAAANRTATEWERKTKEFKTKKLQKQQARERGEEINSDDDDDDDDDEEDDEVVADIEWGDLGSEDALTGAHPLMQGHFLFHAREGTAVRPEEAAGWTVGPSLAPSGVGRSATAPVVPREGGGSAAVPPDTREASPLA